MTPTPPPDVAALIEELNADRNALPGSPAPDTSRDAVADDDLPALLAAANRSCHIRLPEKGWRRWLLRPLGGLLAQINLHHAFTVRTLNRMMRLLEGEDLPESAALQQAQQRRLTLLRQINERLAALEALQLEARLQKLESAGTSGDTRP